MGLNFENSKKINEAINKTSYEELKIFLNNTVTPMKRTAKDVERERLKHFKNINDAYKREEIVLVLGSGVSVPYNIPDWKSLLQKLLLETFNSGGRNSNEAFVLASIYPELFPNSPLISARFLEEDFKIKSATRTFEEAVKGALYETVSRNKDSHTMKEILTYCIAAGKSPNLNSIITYNYDDILEGVIKKAPVEISYKTIYKAGVNPKNGELPIYHVHGYLPQEEEIDKEHIITLSESLYHKQYNDIYSWNNLVQINKFKDNMCIFIGLSLTDPNIRRLLDISVVQRGKKTHNHYLIKKKYSTNKTKRKLRKILEEDESLLNKKGIARLEVDETVNILIKKMEEFEELDAESFGIKIIWINNYDEIADILKRVRIM